jgi:hypothetical protein
MKGYVGEGDTSRSKENTRKNGWERGCKVSKGKEPTLDVRGILLIDSVA